MIGSTTGGQKGLRWGVFALAGVVAFGTLSSDPADARHRPGKHYFGHARAHKHVQLRHRGRIAGYNPPYADIIVDGNSGRVLHATSPDAARHPASLTKMMTLYLLFEQIDAGRLQMDSPMEVSAHASVQAPSKLGLRPGSSITVEQGIKALVTKSANDAAVVIAEAVGGSENDFSRMMTRKARALGMMHTVYVNASGLPDDEQITTARDQATLGRALQDRFPRLYRYFATDTFFFHGRAIRNHNHLTNHMQGVDGIKTGYVRASGFNLVSSMRRDGRHLVGVVLGGTSSGSRDARMRSLLEECVADASVRRTAPKIVEVRDVPKSRAEPERTRVADATRGIETRMTETRGIDTRGIDTRGLDLNREPEPVQEVEQVTRRVAVRPADERLPPRVFSPEPSAKPTTFVKSQPVAAAPVQARSAEVGSVEPIKPIRVRTMSVKRQPQPTVVASAGDDAAVVAAIEGDPKPALHSVPAAKGEWVIQIGAFPAENQAQDRLKAARNVAKVILGGAEPFTERVVKHDTTLYRARFAGFDHESAAAACKYLQRNDIVCLPLKN